MDIEERPDTRPNFMLVWGVIIAAIVLLMAWIFGVPGFTPMIR